MKKILSIILVILVCVFGYLLYNHFNVEKKQNIEEKTEKTIEKKKQEEPMEENKEKNDESQEKKAQEEIKKEPKYSIEIIRNENVVIVYNNEKVEKTFICSVGKNNATPTGNFTTSKGFKWGTLVGGHYAQYSTRIYKGILFHSVPYIKKDPSTLDWEEYNKLGEPASLGCIRMTVADVKWIFDNIPEGTNVYIHDGKLPNGVTKPEFTKIPENSNNKGWDPTDPDTNNPWKK